MNRDSGAVHHNVPFPLAGLVAGARPGLAVTGATAHSAAGWYLKETSS
jgi:hypothetical protein